MKIEDAWPIQNSYETVRQATGWVDVGPACVPWYGGFSAKKAAEEIANLISAAPYLLEALKAVMNGQPDMDAPRFQMARDAIAKAEGK